MRKKYNTFDISKINVKTIEIARKIKNETSKTKKLRAAFLMDSDTPIPKDKDKLLDFLSVKYLNLKPEDGVSILKQAVKKQYNIEDEFKTCKNCKRPFSFERSTSVFCSNRCRQRFYRKGRV